MPIYTQSRIAGQVTVDVQGAASEQRLGLVSASQIAAPVASFLLTSGAPFPCPDAIGQRTVRSAGNLRESIMPGCARSCQLRIPRDREQGFHGMVNTIPRQREQRSTGL